MAQLDERAEARPLAREQRLSVGVLLVALDHLVVVADGTAADYVSVPAVDGPRAPGDLTWASDGSTVSLGQTLPDVLSAFLPAAQ